MHSLPSPEAAAHELVTAWKVLDYYGLVDTVFNHMSVGCQGKADDNFAFAINPTGLLPSMLDAKAVVVVENEGIVGLSGVNEDGLALHHYLQRLRAGRPTAAVHLHAPYSTCVSVFRHGLLPLTQTAMEFAGSVHMIDYHGLFSSGLHEDGALVELCKNGGVGLLRNHGMLAIADSVAEVTYLSYYLEEACKLQTIMLGSVRLEELCVPSADVVKAATTRLAEQRRTVAQLFFEASARRISS